MARRSAGIWPGSGAGILCRALCRLRRRRRPVPQIPDRFCRAAARTPATWRSPTAGTSGTSMRVWPSAKASAPRKPFSCTPSTAALGSAISARWPAWPIASARLFHRRLRRKQARGAADLRGRQHRRRAQHDSPGAVSLQGAPDCARCSTPSRRCCAATPFAAGNARREAKLIPEHVNLRTAGLISKKLIRK